MDNSEWLVKICRCLGMGSRTDDLIKETVLSLNGILMFKNKYLPGEMADMIINIRSGKYKGPCIAAVSCPREADCTTLLYKTKAEKRTCYQCANAWLLDTSRCPKCGKDKDECSQSCKYSGSLDRGVLID